MNKLPCVSCGSTDGQFLSFFNNREHRTNYYWVCLCGRNKGHAGTKEGAIDTWNKFQEELKGGQDD